MLDFSELKASESDEWDAFVRGRPGGQFAHSTYRDLIAGSSCGLSDLNAAFLLAQLEAARQVKDLRALTGGRGFRAPANRAGGL